MLVVYTRFEPTSERLFADWPSSEWPAAYQPRVNAMSDAGARARTVAGLWLLGQALAQRGERVILSRIGFSATGRPEFADGPWFSISHSADLVACALSWQAPVGLDVEKRRDDISPRLVRAMAGDQADFFAAWCAREATVKATGRVGLARVRATRLAGDQAYLDGRSWRLRPVSLVPDYAGCLATEATEAGAAADAMLDIQALTPPGDSANALRRNRLLTRPNPVDNG